MVRESQGNLCYQHAMMTLMMSNVNSFFCNVQGLPSSKISLPSSIYKDEYV